LYHEVPVERTIEDLYDGSLDDTEIADFISANIEAAQKEYNSVVKKAPKISTDKSKYLQEKQAYQEEVGKAKAKVDYWQAVENERQHITHTSPEELKNAEDELSGEAARKDYRGITAGDEENPTSVEDLVRDFLRGAKITPEDFRKETGLSISEQKKFVGMISKQGKTIARLGEELADYDEWNLGGRFFDGDSNAARGAIIDVLLSSRTRGDFKQQDATEEEEERYIEAVEQQREQWYYENYHMTYEEYLQYREIVLPELLRKYANFAPDILYPQFVASFEDAYVAEHSQTNNTENNEQQRNDTTAEEPTTTPGDTVLQTEETNNSRGDSQSEEQPTEVPTGVRSSNENGTLPQSTPTEVESETDYTLSDKKAENGENFYQDANGNIDLANIPEEVFDKIGKPKAPLRLTPSMLKHVFDRHGKEMGLSPTDDAIDFILDVMDNFDHVRQGDKNAVIFSIENGRSRTGRRAVTILLNSESGEYYGIKTSGYERIEGLNKKPLLWEKGANETSATGAAPANVTTEQTQQGSEPAGSASNHSNGSIGKDTQSSQTKQEKEDKFVAAPRKDGESITDYAERVAEEHQAQRTRKEEEAKVDTNPTDAQKEAGNYKKGHIKVDGLNITIEQPKGSIRRGTDANGKQWESEMHNTYGYIRGTESVDGDHIDIFLSDNPTEGNVFVVDQINKDGSFDEHKVMYGFSDMESARQAYLSNYEEDWQGLGNITEVSKEDFKAWIDSSKRKTKPFTEYTSAKTQDDTQTKKPTEENAAPANTETNENYAHNSEEIMHEQKNVQLQQAINAYENATKFYYQQLKEGKLDKVFESKQWKDVLRKQTELQKVLLQLNSEELKELLKQTTNEDTKKEIKGALDAVLRQEQRSIEYNAVLDKQEPITPIYKEEKNPIAVTEFVETDKKEAEIHPVLTGVYHDNGYVVGTNAHILLARKEDYNKSLEGKITNKKGEVIDGKYPNWRAVVEGETTTNSWGINLDKLHAFVRGVLTKLKADGAKKSTIDSATIAFKDTDGKIIVCNAKTLDKALRGAKSIGATEFGNKSETFAHAQTKKGYVVCPTISTYHSINDNCFVYAPKEAARQQTTATLTNDTEAKQKATEAVLAALSKAGIEVVRATDEEVKALLANTHATSLRTPQGTIYGWSVNGKIYLTEAGINPDTPIHEYTHLWAEAMMIKNKKGWDSIKALLKDNPIWNEVVADANYSNIADNEDAVASEVLSRISGRKNAAKMEEEAQRAIDEAKGVFEKARATTILTNLKKALNSLWKWVSKNIFDVKEFSSINEVTDKVLYDLIHGTKLINDKSLIGVHNISEQKLRKVLKQGGFANPSIAVIDTDKQVHNDYGEISLILPSRKVNKSTGKNVGTYEGDAWTPMYPIIEKQMSSDGSLIMHNDINSVPNEMQSEVRNALNRWLDNGSDTDLSYLYLFQQGKAPKMATVKPKYSNEVYKSLRDIMFGVDSVYNLTKGEVKKLVELYVQTELNGDIDEYNKANERRIAKYKETIESGRTNSMYYKIAEINLEEVKKYGYPLSSLKTFADDVQRDKTKQGSKNVQKTLNAASQIIKDAGLEEDFRNWVEGLNNRYQTKEVIFDGFTPTGKRRYIPNTLENVSKLMKKQGRQASTGLGVSFSNFAASVMKANGSLANIRKKKSKLTNEHKDIENFEEKWKEVYFDLAMKLQPNASTFDDYGFTRLQEAALEADPQAFLSKEYGVTLSKEDVRKLQQMVKAIQEERPAMYFETKFERPVTLNEFSKAVVPEDLSDDLQKTLRDNGIEIFTYKRGDAEDRQKATQEAAYSSDDIAFQIINNGNNEADNDSDTLYRTVFGGNSGYVGYSLSKRAAEVKEEGRDIETPTDVEELIQHATQTARSLNLDNVEVVADGSIFKDKKATAKGFYNKRTGKITIIASNHTDIADIEKTVLHEGVAHYGLRKLFGDNFNAFLDTVFAKADIKTRRQIAHLSAKHGWNIRTATEEYLAGMAEDANFEQLKPTTWQRIKRLFGEMMSALGLHHSDVTDNDLRYLLWRSYKNLENGGKRSILDMAEDIAMQYRLKVGNYTDKFTDELNAVNERFNEKLSNLTEENADKVALNLGTPSAILRAAGVENKPMKLYGNKVIKKIKKHGFALEELKDLPKAVANPIAVFNNYKKEGNRSILTELKTKQGNFLVTIDLGKGTEDIDFNIVSSVFGKDSGNIVDWIERGLAVYINKEKALNYLHHSALRAEALSSSRLNSAAKIIKDFHNPKLNSNVLYRSSIDPTATEVLPDARTRYEKETKEPDNIDSVPKTHNFFRRFYKSYVDSMLALKSFTNSVLEATGDKMASHEDTYKAENAMTSKNKTDGEVYNRDYYNPLLTAAQQLCEAVGMDYDALNMYMVAKHGLERNEYMGKRAAQNDENVLKAKKTLEDAQAAYNEDPTSKNEAAIQKAQEKYTNVYNKALEVHTNKDYSGLTELTDKEDVAEAEYEAQKIVDAVETSDVMPKVTAFWSKVNAATKQTLKTGYESGIMTKDTYEHILNMYKYYIPLRGWAEPTADDVYTYYNNRSYEGKPLTKTAKGRTSLAEDPMAIIASMAQRSIIEANRNKMKQTFLNFVLNHPTSLATVGEQWYIKNALGEWERSDANIPANATPDEISKLVAEHEQEMQTLAETGEAIKQRNGLKLDKRVINGEGAEHTIKVWRGGKEYIIYINGNPAVAQAVNGLTNPDTQGSDLPKWAKIGAAQLKNFLSGVYTSFSPAFVLTNFTRDQLFASQAVYIKYGLKYKRQASKNARNLFFSGALPRLVYKWEHGTLDLNNETERYFDEFMRGGGETGFTALRDIESIKKEIKDAINGNKANIAKRGWKSFINAVEFANRSAEDFSRFVTFMTSRQQGKSIVDAIYDAKDITVNFNKKGSGEMGSRFMNFAYIFFNAAVQSINNFGTMLKQHPARTMLIISKFGALGFGVPMLNAFLTALCGGGDDDKYWDNMDWVRRNNIVLRIPFLEKTFISIPLPQELRPFYGMGEIAASILFGKETFSSGLQKAVEGFTGLLPIDFTGNGGNLPITLTPTVLQPVAQYMFNTDYFGRKVYNDNENKKIAPGWTKAFSSTPPVLIEATKFLNSLTGGNDVDKGAVSLNPDVINHFVKGYFGGPATFVTQMSSLLYKGFSGDAKEIRWRDIPVASRFVQQLDERSVRSSAQGSYKDFKEETEETEYRLSNYKKQVKMGKMEYAKMITDLIKSPEYQRYKIAKAYKKPMDLLKEALNHIDNTTDKKEVEKALTGLRHYMMETVESEQKGKHAKREEDFNYLGDNLSELSNNLKYSLRSLKQNEEQRLDGEEDDGIEELISEDKETTMRIIREMNKLFKKK